MKNKPQMSENEFQHRFREKFGRDFSNQEPLMSLTEAEYKFVSGHIFRWIDDFLYQFTYGDPVTDLTYEVFYKFDVDQSKAIVAYALLGDTKVRLTGGLRRRMTSAAFDQWLKEADEDCIAELIADQPALQCAFAC